MAFIAYLAADPGLEPGPLPSTAAIDDVQLMGEAFCQLN
jgi:hypothetical protein